MQRTFKVISPVDGSVYAECRRHGPEDVETALQKAVESGQRWRQAPLSERISFLKRFVAYRMQFPGAVSLPTWPYRHNNGSLFFTNG